jgi:hypothetical protein
MRDAVRALSGVVIRLELGHVLDRNLNRHLHRLQAARIDDGDVPAGTTKELRDLLERTLRGGETDALGLDLRQR